MKLKFLFMLMLTMVLSFFASSKGFSGCEKPEIACNNKCTGDVIQYDKMATDADMLQLSPINTIMLL